MSRTWVTVREALRHMPVGRKVSRSTLERAIGAGFVEVLRVSPRRTLVSLESLDAWANRRVGLVLDKP